MAKATISKNNQKKTYGNAADVIIVKGSGNKIYTKGGKDKITITKGKNNMIDAGKGNDTIIVGKKAGDDNTVKAGAGVDKITIHKGTQSVMGDAGNDIITVNGGNYHTLQGGAGSDKYIVKTAMAKSALLTIDQSNAGKKDKDILQLTKVSKKDVKFGIANGTLSIKHKSGGGIVVTGWNKRNLSQIQFKNGTLTAKAINKSSKKTKPTSITWKTGAKVSKNGRSIVSELQVTGHKAGDLVATLNSKGQLILREKEGGKGILTLSNWKNNTVSKFVFKTGNYSRTFTAAEFKERTYTLTPLKDKAKYTGGQDVNQEFQINFSENTDIVINTTRSGGNRDRIRFTNAGGWSNEHEDLFVNGNNLVLWNWNPDKGTNDPGQIIIQNYMKSSVREIEFSNQTYHLITGSGTWSGSDTYSDRFVFLARYKTGNDPNKADWNVTLDNVRKNDWIDLKALFVNSRYYSLSGAANGRDMVLTYRCSPAPSTLATLGTLRLKNFFNANGTVNTAEGYARVRIRREFYAGEFAEDTFDGPKWEGDKTYRKAYLNAGTAGADTVDLGNLSKKNDNFVWMYYAGDGNDTITAHAGDIVYGGNGADILNVEGTMSDIHGNAGDDTITVRAGLKKVNIYGDEGKDTIYAYGSQHFVMGGADNDKIYIGNDFGETAAEKSFANGGNGDDTIYIQGGQNHRVHGGRGNDKITVEDGNKIYMRGQYGSDQYIIATAFDANTKFTIDQRGFEAGDKDTLELTNVSKDDVTYDFRDDGALGICHVDGGEILVRGWNANPLDSIKFADGTMTKRDIEA